MTSIFRPGGLSPAARTPLLWTLFSLAALVTAGCGPTGDTEVSDRDQDGVTVEAGDCDDLNRTIYPGAAEIPYDGLDQNCDGQDMTDADLDSYPSIVVEGGTDCDDTDPYVNPRGLDVPYNGVDEDCKGGDDVDADNDGFNSNRYGGTDCDDTDSEIHPGAEDTPYDGIDQDCSGKDLIDADGDGYSPPQEGGRDCNDRNPAINPAAEEIQCNGTDEDCNGADPCDSGGSGGGPTDLDRDGYVDAGAGGNDCDDQDATIHPGAVDVKDDGIDQNCDGRDSTSNPDGVDSDGDGYTSIESGGDDPDDTDPDIHPNIDADGDGYTSIESGGDDPDDTDPDIHPGADDPPGDGIDQDGDGKDGPGVVPYDGDGDGYPSKATGGTDCNDEDPTVHPGATEIQADGIDQDCNGIDAGAVDGDGDGHASIATGGDDCDDKDLSVYPGANDPSGDDIDQDCNGTDGTGNASTAPVDQDRDGYASGTRGGNDCDDRDPTIHPGAVDIGNDGIDQDCSGSDATTTTGVDEDGDGYTSQESGGDDPDDHDPDVHPGAYDPPGDGIDQDGSGEDGPGVVPVDADDDGYESAGTGGKDCNDGDPTIHPDATDIPDDEIDQDCDGRDAGGTTPIDNDLDGYLSESSGGSDCDDRDPRVHPGATDPSGDGIDQDCNGFDGTGAVNTGDSTIVDQDRDGYVAVYAGGNDCNDSDPRIHPGAVDKANDGIDQDCSGTDATTTTGVDSDGDGYTSESSGGDDCNDNDPDVHPGAQDPLGDGDDQDCDGNDGPGVMPYDGDGDGYAAEATGGTDCNDNDPKVNPKAVETPNNGKDENCDGLDGGSPVPVDQDGDGYASSATGGKDCNDFDPTIHPGAQDPLGDCVDSDCSGSDSSDGPPVTGLDQDKDGFYACASGGNDCDDNDEDIHPGATDIAYNGVDEDCSGADLTDFDLDGYSSTRVAGGTDCNDTAKSIHPGATETAYNGVDEDCSGADLTDVDGDGYRSTRVAGGNDCDDSRSGVNPGATDLAYNGIDENCDGTDYNDVDGDGYPSTKVSGGTDCDDNNFNIHPGAKEQGDGMDNDCDGKTDESTVLYDDDGDGLSEVQGDCDDGNAQIKPGATEVIDAKDNDCDGYIDNTEDAPDFDLADGWNFYAAGEYDDAKIAFTAVLTGNPFEADGYNGLGWTAYRQGDVTSAGYYFDMAIALEPELADALAGRSGASAIQSRHDLTITYAERCLAADPLFASFHDPVDVDRLLVSLARAYLYEGDLRAAQRTLDELEPANGLNPYVSSSWRVNTRTYPNYRTALLAKLQAVQRSLP